MTLYTEKKNLFNNCHFQSCRAGGWKEGGTFKRLMALNVDVSNKPALKNLHLTEETSKGKGDSYIAQVLIVNNALNRFAYPVFITGPFFTDFSP